MKNLSIRMLSLLVTLPLSSFCYSANVTPVCPDATLIQTTPVGYSATGRPNEPVTVITSINKYGTDHYWSMNFQVSSGTLQGAIQKAKQSLSSLRFDFGPHYYQGKWICSYQVTEPGVLKVSAETSDK